jgi:hypothetical protein
MSFRCIPQLVTSYESIKLKSKDGLDYVVGRPESYELTVSVDEAHRRRRIGTRVMNDYITSARATGAAWIGLTTEYTYLHGWYKGLGFSQVSEGHGWVQFRLVLQQHNSTMYVTRGCDDPTPAQAVAQTFMPDVVKRHEKCNGPQANRLAGNTVTGKQCNNT